jgi:hypothetical protein
VAAKKAVRLDPREVQYLNTLGQAYVTAGQYEEAITTLIAACKCLRPIAKFPYGSISDRVTSACGGGSRRRRVIHSCSGPHLSGRPDIH